MKKYFLSVILLISALTIYGQGPHKPLNECNNDTIEYVAYNFGENKTRYIGQPVGKLLDEVDFKIKDFFPMSTYGYSDKNNGDKIDGLYLYYVGRRDQSQYEKAKFLYICIKISFEEPYIKTESEYKTIRDKYGFDIRWRPEFFEFFKDNIVKDIELIRLKGK